MIPTYPKELGFDPSKFPSWRPHQQEIIEKLLEAEEPFLLVEALPGFGKSLVAAAISQMTLGRVLILTKCLDGDTPVLMADLTWKPIRDIQQGERVVAFDEHPLPGRQMKSRRKLRLTTVSNTSQHWSEDCFEIKTDKGSVVSNGEHPWLVMDKHRRLTWRATRDLNPQDQIKWLTTPTQPENSAEAGYLSGAFDGEGHIRYRNKIAGGGGLDGVDLQFTGKATVSSISPVESRILYNIETETQTFIANGLFSHNTKQLQQQYLREFPFITTLEGKDSFECALPKTTQSVQEAPCQVGWNCTRKSSCPYFVQQRKAMSSRVMVTNYSKALTSWMGRWDWVICDEGHLLERQIINSYTIRLEHDAFKRAGIKIPSFGSIRDAAHWATSKQATVSREVTGLEATLRLIPAGGNDWAPANMRDKWRAFKSIGRPLEALANADLEAVWSMEPYRKALHLKPLWASRHTHNLWAGAQHVVVQSATILDPNRLSRLLGLSKHRYFSVPSILPKERRPIYIWPVVHLGIKSKPTEMSKLLIAVDRILARYPQSRGIIHTVNWTLTKEIAKQSKFKSRFVVQDSGKRRTQAIDKFLSTPYAVLVSPSVMTGLDGRFESARFQIIAKMPFENQGEQAIRERVDEDADWYAYQTAFNIQQAAGRVMRDKVDYGETWILDDNFLWFYKQFPHLFGDWFKEAIGRKSP